MTDKIADNCNNGLVYKELAGLKVGDIYQYDPHRFSPYFQRYVVSFLYKSMGAPIAVIIFEDGFAQDCVNPENIKKDIYIETLPNWFDAFTQNKLNKVYKENN